MKGQPYGSLRGSARKKVVEDFRVAKKPPSEFAKDQLALVTASVFHSENRGVLPSRETARAISGEAKASRRKDIGLGSCRLGSIMSVNYRIKCMDLQQRRTIIDNSTNLTGIVRDITMGVDFKMDLWAKTSVMIYHSLAKTGRLVVSADPSGGMLKFPFNEHMTDKILHTKVCISPKVVLLSLEHLDDDRKNRLLSPVTICELVSNKNTAVDIGSFYSAFRDSERELYPGEVPVKPLMFSTDCSPQLQSASLATFARCPTLTRMQYSNVVLVHLQYFDSVAFTVQERGSATLKLTAQMVMKSLDHYGIDVFLKECKSHVWRAPCHWVHTSKVPEIISERAHFGSMVSGLFKALLEYPNVTEAIASLAVVIAVLETEDFPLEIKSFNSRKLRE